MGAVPAYRIQDDTKRNAEAIKHYEKYERVSMYLGNSTDGNAPIVEYQILNKLLEPESKRANT